MGLQKGITLMHEHMHIDLSGVKQDEDCHMDCFEETKKELQELYRHGVRNIWEVTNIGMGRDVSYIRRLEQETGIHFLISTGCYKEPFLPQACMEMNVDELADLMIQELQVGIANTQEKADAIGEIGTSKNEWTAQEQKLFDAALLAHKATNCPIYTHTTLGTLGLQQAQYFQRSHCDLSKIVIGHMDLSGDLDVIRSVLDTGVNIGFDTVGKNQYFPDEKRVAFLMELAQEGKLHQVVLSEDLTRKSHLKYRGGIGYSYLFDTFLPMLKQAGMKQGSIDLMLMENPSRIFA